MSVKGLLPPPPETPGDLDAAREYHQRIMALLDADDAEHEAKSRDMQKRPRQFPRLTKSQRVQLRDRLEPMWLKRAIGADLRWNLYGTGKAGRLPRDLERACRGEPIRAKPPSAPVPDPEFANWIRAKPRTPKEL